jgi:hypothetical protein
VAFNLMLGQQRVFVFSNAGETQSHGRRRRCLKPDVIAGDAATEDINGQRDGGSSDRKTMLAVNEDDVGQCVVHLDDVERILSGGVFSANRGQRSGLVDALALFDQPHRIHLRNAAPISVQGSRFQTPLTTCKREVLIRAHHRRFLLPGEKPVHAFLQNRFYGLLKKPDTVASTARCPTSAPVRQI